MAEKISRENCCPIDIARTIQGLKAIRREAQSAIKHLTELESKVGKNE